MLSSLLFAAALLTAPDLSPNQLAAPDSVVRAGAIAPGDSVLFGDLADGASYRRIRSARGVIMHVLTIDLRKGLNVEAVKARDSYDGLETLTELYERAEREARRDGDTILAAINAGPWHHEKLSPIGPLVVDGNVVEIVTDDAWSSLLLYGDNVAVTRDRVSGAVYWRHRTIDIRSVNRRLNSGGLAIYNPMFGTVVPDTTTQSAKQIVADVLANLERDDSGIDFAGEEIDSAEIVRRYQFTRQGLDQETRAFKIAVRRLQTARSDWFGEPRINDTMWTSIVAVGAGAMAIPHDGFVISPGASEDWFRAARYGDTRFRILFQVARNGIGVVHEVVPGYPQLLFEGAPASEPEFAQGPAGDIRADIATARTAVGITASDDTLFLVAVEAPTKAGVGGLTIDELTHMMRALGAHNALAMEGQASSSMVVNYETVTHSQHEPSLRRISNALVVKKKRRW